VKIRRISPGGQEHNYLRVFFAAFPVTFFYPCGYFPAIRRVTPRYMAVPILNKSVLMRGEVKLTFGIVGERTGIQCKAELFVQLVKECLWRFSNIVFR
jgi:hypothetical protein